MSDRRVSQATAAGRGQSAPSAAATCSGPPVRPKREDLVEPIRCDLADAPLMTLAAGQASLWAYTRRTR